MKRPRAPGTSRISASLLLPAIFVLVLLPLVVLESGCALSPVSTTVVVEWNVDHLTLEKHTEDSDIIAVGEIVKIDPARWNSPDGEQWKPSDEQNVAVLYTTFYVEPTALLSGDPEWGAPIAFRIQEGVVGGNADLSVGASVVAFGASDGRYGLGAVYQPAGAYWLTNGNNSIWVQKDGAGLYRNQGITKDSSEGAMTLEEIEDKVRDCLPASASNGATTYSVPTATTVAAQLSSTSTTLAPGVMTFESLVMRFETLVTRKGLAGTLPYSVMETEELAWLSDTAPQVTVTEARGYRFANGDVVILFYCEPVKADSLGAAVQVLTLLAEDRYRAYDGGVWASVEDGFGYVVVSKEYRSELGTYSQWARSAYQSLIDGK